MDKQINGYYWYILQNFLQVFLNIFCCLPQVIFSKLDISYLTYPKGLFWYFNKFLLIFVKCCI